MKTFTQALDSLGVPMKARTVAAWRKARQSHYLADRIKRYPGRTDYTIVQSCFDSDIGRVMTREERYHYDRSTRYLHRKPANDKRSAEHQLMLLAQCPDGASRTAEYVRQFCELNHLIP